MANAQELLKKEWKSFKKKYNGMVAEDILPAAYMNSTAPQSTVQDGMKKEPESVDDIANMSDEEVKDYFYNQLPKKQIDVAPDLKQGLFDRISKITKAEEAKKNLTVSVESMLRDIRNFKF